MYGFVLICLLLNFTGLVLTTHCDFNLIWFEGNNTKSHYYTAREEVPESLENATKITLNQKISVLRSFDLGFAKNLKTLTMDLCGLTDIEPESFKNLSPLTDLSITRNNIKVIKNGVFNYMDVIHLNLSHNKITTIKPSAFDHMHNLKSVILDHNELTIYALSLQNCPNITLISMKFNFVQYLPEGMFKAVKTHKLNVYLSYNKVQKIHPDAFEVDEFGDFCLDHNEIEDLDCYGLKKIHNLDLHDNHIECIQNAFLEEELRNVTIVNLKQNPINCTCLKELQGYKNVLVTPLEEEC